jgi:aryl-alcohol dehydrogenase-like predicted oxidoreductase
MSTSPPLPEDPLIDRGQRSLGASLHCGPLGFGCWRFTHGDPVAAQRTLEAALDAGMTLIDTADVYGLDWGGTGFGTVERLLGQVLSGAPGLRDRMVLATKGGIVPPVPYDASPKALRTACESSLRRLGVERIDLYQVHRPDLFTHPGAVADTLAALVAEGKVAEVGSSNHTPSQHEALAAALAERGIQIASTQVEYSATHLGPLRDGTFDLAMRHGLGVLTWSPLAGGALAADGPISGRVRPELLAVLDELADQHNTDRTTVALAFALAHPCRPVVLIGSQHPNRIAAAAEATNIPLTRTDAYRIIEASEGTPLP